MRDDQALTPSADDIMPILDESEIIETVAVDEAHEQEKILASVGSMQGWQVIAAKMQADIDGLRTGSSITVDTNTPLEEVGKKYVIAIAVATHLQTYLDMVNNSREAVAEYERRKNESATAK